MQPVQSITMLNKQQLCEKISGGCLYTLAFYAVLAINSRAHLEICTPPNFVMPHQIGMFRNSTDGSYPLNGIY